MSEPAARVPTVGHVIGGAQKSGTTTLHAALCDVPGLVMSAPKEAHVFDRAEYPRGDAFDHVEAVYRRHFPAEVDGRIRVEATPAYLWHVAAVDRIARYNPAMKWIVCLRNPVARAHSHYRMLCRHGSEARPFLACVEEAVAALAAAPPTGDRLPADPRGLLSRGLYADQIARLWRVFGAERVQLVLTAELRRDLPRVAADVVAFVTRGAVSPPGSVDAGPGGGEAMDPVAARLLAEFYAPEVARLSAVLGLDLGRWLDDPAAD